MLLTLCRAAQPEEDNPFYADLPEGRISCRAHLLENLPEPLTLDNLCHVVRPEGSSSYSVILPKVSINQDAYHTGEQATLLKEDLHIPSK